MVDPTSLDAFDPKMSGTFASSFLIIIAIIILSMPLSIMKIYDTDAQSQATKSRDLVAGFENNTIHSRAQLTLPAINNGSFPGVLLIPGSGAADMDEYLPPELAGVENGSRPFLQIANYLSERGFAVLRYDKRGVGENSTVIDANLLENATVHKLQNDAEDALKVLLDQPEVDRDEITLIGHSEGAVMAPRIASKQPQDVKNVVLMGASSQTLYDLVIEKANRNLFLARNYWDYDKDGQLSLEEVMVHPEAGLTIPNASSSSGDNSSRQQWYPGIDKDNDNMININNELTPFALTLFSQMESDPWYQSHKQIQPTVEIIENLQRQNILILQGEKDIQTNIEQALLLEQKLTKLKHPDHSLITYPGLGHTFYPAEGPNELLGPIQDYVLADLHAWLKERSFQK